MVWLEDVFVVKKIDIDKDCNAILNDRYMVPWFLGNYQDTDRCLNKKIAIQYIKSEKLNQESNIKEITRTVIELKCIK